MKYVLKSCLLPLLFTMPLIAAADEAASQANVPSHADVAYVADGNQRHLLDLYLPDNADSARPLVIYIHGGGWVVGHKGSAALSKVSGLHRLVKTLRESGYAVASINYRLSGEAVYPAQLEDVQAAIGYLVENAQKYGVDAKRIALTGDSAGAHLALLAAAQAGKEQIKAVVSYYGVSDVRNVNMERLAKNCPENIQTLMGKFMEKAPENTPEGLLVGSPYHSMEFNRKADAASPINYLNDNTPPMMLLHGDADCWVPHTQSLKLHDALQQAGITAELLILEQTGHSATRFFDADINEKVLHFLKQQL